MTLEFEWDPEKAANNLVKHGVSFTAARGVFADPSLFVEDDPLSIGEYRFMAIGMTEGVVLAVVYSEPTQDVIRLISARRATARERKSYYDQIR